MCLLEDVVTSGGAALDAVEALREAGLSAKRPSVWSIGEEGGEAELALHGVKLRPLYVAAELLSTRKTAANPHG